MKRKLRFGTAGVPQSAKKRDSIEGIKRVKELGLDHMELEFVHGVRMGEESAEEVRKTAEKEGITLTVHGSYYINLASKDKKIWHASMGRVGKAAKIGDIAGAKSVTFHPAAFQGREHDPVYDLVKQAIVKVYKELDKLEIRIAPELTGKGAQFGDLEDLVSLANEFKKNNLRFCIDFSHKFARSNGKFNTYEEFDQILKYIAKKAGKKHLEELHIHISGIEYSEKGERNHLLFLNSVKEYEKYDIKIPGLEKVYKGLSDKKKQPNTFNWQDCLKALKDNNVGGYVVCESPIQELDALLMKKYYESL